MRVISGFGAAAMLAALAQPALASCVYHGAAKVCHDDPKYWSPAVALDPPGPEKEAPAEPPASSLKTIVMQPSASVDNAWVMRPESGDGASAPATVHVAVPACEPGTNC
jgi:hypothetical protein